MRIYSELNFALIALAANLTIVGTLVAAVVAATFKATRALHPRARYVIAVIAFFIAALWPVWGTFSPSRTAQARNLRYVAGLPSPMRAITQPSNSSHQNPVNSESVSPETRDDGPSWITNQVHWLNNTRFTNGFLGLWFIVSAILLLREIVGHLHLLRRRRSWWAVANDLRKAADWRSALPLYAHANEHVGPFTAGFLRPAVVIPQDLITKLSHHELRWVVRHELAHARWRDPLVKTMLRAVRAILWPCVGLWYLERRIRQETEAAADRAALGDGQTSETFWPGSAYAGLLLSMAKRKVAVAGRCGFISSVTGDSDLEKRIRRLLVRPSRFSPWRLLVAGSLISVGAFVITLLPLVSRSASVGDTSHHESGGSSTKGHTEILTLRPSPLAERAGGDARAVETYNSFFREPRTAKTDAGRQNIPGQALPYTPVPAAQLDEQPIRDQGSRQKSPQAGPQGSDEVSSINEKMTREMTARQNEEAARQLPARNAEWTRHQNAEAASNLPARNAAWTAEQNAAAARDLRRKNAEDP